MSTTATITNKYGDKAIEASDLGFKVPPAQIVLEGELYRQYSLVYDNDGELVSWEYQGVQSGNFLTVFND